MSVLPTQEIPAENAVSLPAQDSRWKVGTLEYDRPGIVRLFSWLLWGDFAWATRDRSLNPVLQLLLSKFQASDAVAGLLIGTFPAAVGLVLGPIISFRSDRYRGPRGRRLPFLLVAAPVAALSVIGLGFSPVLGQWLHGFLGSHSPGHFPSVLIVLAIWWIIFDFAAVVTNGIFSALINDVVPHGIIGRFFGLFRAVSLVIGIIFNYWLLEKAEQHYQWMFAAVGAIYGIGIVLMCLNVREGEYPPPPPVGEGGGLKRFLLSTREYFRVCFSEPYYRWFFVGSNLAILTMLPVNLYSVFFAKSVNMSMSSYGFYIACTYCVSLSMTYWLGCLADRIHPLRLTMLVVGLYGAGMLWGAMFATSAGTFAIALVAHGVLSGGFYTASASLAQRVLPRESFAQMASAGGIVGALLNMVLPPALGHILDLSGHNYRLVFLAGSILSLLTLVCLVVVYRYWKTFASSASTLSPTPGVL